MLERRIELSTGPGGTLPLAPGLMVAILATITMQDLTHEDIPTVKVCIYNKLLEEIGKIRIVVNNTIASKNIIYIKALVIKYDILRAF